MLRETEALMRRVFSGTPVIGSLAPELREELLASTKVRRLRSGEVLWREGEVARHLGIVLSGRLTTLRTAAARDVIVDVLGPGDAAGEVAFALGERYQFEVRSLRPTWVALVSTQHLRGMLEERPAAAVALALTLAHQVLRLTRRLEMLSSGSVERRLASVLIGLAERFGEEFPGGVLLPLRLRRKDLASLAATTLETASRTVSRWRRERIIEPMPSGFLIRDRHRLARVAAGQEALEV
jgi:CRP-like cAMP-binding protein